MIKKIIFTTVLSLSTCAANAQAELLIGAQYIGQFLGASSQNEKRIKAESERKAKAEEDKLKKEEGLAKTQLLRDASDRSKKETEVELHARYEALESKFKEDNYQLELAHVRTVNKIGRNNGALAEERVVYDHKRQTLLDSYNKDRKSAEIKARNDAAELTNKYREEGMVELNKKYHPVAVPKDVNSSASDTSIPSN